LLKQLKEKYNQPVPFILNDNDNNNNDSKRVQNSNQNNSVNVANNLLLSSSSLTDISKNLAKGLSTWGLAQPTSGSNDYSNTNSLPLNNSMISNADDMLWMSRINSLQSEVNTLEHDKAELLSDNKKL
jgi:hypothetical protein